jgi:hypothetical protein
MRRVSSRAAATCCDLFRPNKTIHDPRCQRATLKRAKKSGGKHASVLAAAAPTNHNQPEMPANTGKMFVCVRPEL